MPRSRARMLPSVSSPRARWALAMMPARSTIAGTASSVARATNANRGDSPRRSRSRTKLRGSVVSPNSPIDVEIANSRTSVWPAKSTPSAVASNGPIVNRTWVPARVKTLTRTTEIAIGRVRSSEIRTSRPAIPAATAAGRTARAMIASGPRYPPMTKAPSDSTVARTAFVSGFSR